MTAPPNGRALQDITFGAGGNDRFYLGAGWSGDEPGFRWMVGRESEVWLEHPGAAAGYVLDLAVQPFLAPAVPRQTLTIRVRGHDMARATFQSGGAVGCLIRTDVLAGPGPVRVTFDHPNAAAPRALGIGGDDRVLAFSVSHLSLTALDAAPVAAPLRGRGGIRPDAIQGLTGLTPEQLALRFDSLGDNCEFGLVQRRCGAEPLSLLRFANFHLPPLLAALRDRFARIGSPDKLRVRLSEGGRREYIVDDDSYGTTYHTFQYEDEVALADLAAKQPARQRFLARKLLEDLAADEKVFVLRRNPPLALAQVLPVFTAIRRLGARRLLWVDVAGPDSGPPGTVTEIVPGLYRGALDRLAPDANAHDLSLEVWLEVLANTWRQVVASRDTAGTGDRV